MPAKQPISLVEAKRRKHLTKAEVEKRKSSEVYAPDDNIVAPDYLTDECKNRFYEISGQLQAAKIMANLDCDALARYVSAEFQYQQVTSKLLKSKTVNDKYITLTILQDRLFKQARSAAGDLGLTITSRCKITLPKLEKKEEPTEFERKFGNI